MSKTDLLVEVFNETSMYICVQKMNNNKYYCSKAKPPEEEPPCRSCGWRKGYDDIVKNFHRTPDNESPYYSAWKGYYIDKSGQKKTD